MEQETTILQLTRRALMARTGLVGLGAAAIIAAGVLLFGAWGTPGGTLAAAGGNTANQGLVLANGGGPGPGDHGGMPGGFGGGITITAIDGSTISLKTLDGWTRTITIAGDTTLQKAGAAIKLVDLKVGDSISFQQARQTDGSFKITLLAVVLPHVDGKVTAVTSSSITVTQRDGTAATFDVTSSTTYQVGGATGALSGVKVGMVVDAEGTKASDGTLTASRVRAFDPSTFPGGGMGRHGMGPGWGPMGPDVDPAPSGTSSNNG